MQTPTHLNHSRIVLKRDSTLIGAIEMSLSSWLVGDIVPGVERQPWKKLAIDESALPKLITRWREEAEKAGRKIERIAVDFEGPIQGLIRITSRPCSGEGQGADIVARSRPTRDCADGDFAALRRTTER